MSFGRHQLIYICEGVLTAVANRAARNGDICLGTTTTTSKLREIFVYGAQRLGSKQQRAEFSASELAEKIVAASMPY